MAISYPTFVDGAILTATQLNQLSTAVDTLRSAVETVGYAFLSKTISDDNPATGVADFWLRHSQRYLVFRATGTVNDFDVTITPEGGAPILFEIGDAELDWEAAPLDLQTEVPLLAAGQFYTMHIEIREPNTSTMTIFLIYERTTA